MSAAAAPVADPSQAPRWLPAYVGVGSNLASPREQVQRALAGLAQLRDSRLVLSSPLYHTAPLGEVVQPPFVNAVAGMLTRLSPEDFLEELRALERTLGREPPRERWGPRVIDLDLLVLGRETRATDALNLPHPGIAGRDFVLYPLADIAPDLEVPGLGRVASLRARVANRGMRKL
ncbi:MAG TPA: 2-amino-4-hydroxy-6-hydroxymethyldihydropteridine diphosphokinase [Steroidobacteraceae bacterium]|jgi:2-amino-4-hydroxy-6-hydroxymethyldihydropteridine diphosphokinase|nr:2-amino-4-hydroxy-6-hydroxymethyldihydropteridine diphosphokinase [Steroidobacteraceae bacterium]